MASTMTIPHLTALPNFPGAIPGPIPGPMHGGVPTGIPTGYPVPVSVVQNGQVMSPPAASNPTTISSPIQAVRVPMVPVGGGCYNDGMEVVWHGEFSRLFSNFFPPHVWYLSITNSAPPEKWKYCRDSAKVRFCCQDCGNGWTSMKGRVTFWFHLNLATNEGFVQFKLYGQVCKKCNSGKFEYVMWYPEEVSKVMCNLYNKVGQTYYGFLQPPIRIDRRPGRPRNQHNAELCQACRDGECDQGRPIKTMYNFLPPTVNGQPPNPAMPHPQMPPNSVATVMQPPVPVVIRQPPMVAPRHVIMQPPVNSSTAMTIPIQASSAGPALITPPVTLTSGVQPILTYSIVTGTIKEPTSKLSLLSESFTPSSASSGVVKEVNKEEIASTTSTESTTVAANLAKKASTTASPLVNGKPEKKIPIRVVKPVEQVHQAKKSGSSSLANGNHEAKKENGVSSPKLEKQSSPKAAISNGHGDKASMSSTINGMTALEIK